MKNFAVPLLLAVVLLPLVSSGALDLKQSTFTQVINDVQIISGADKTAKAAAVDDLFKTPDLVRTGPDSRAELVAADQTITRVGANTIFSFDPANRTIDLQKGSLLFHSPKGRGGGTIQTGSATASVLGTTIVVATTPNGGFKVLVLEGTAEIKFLHGLKQQLNAGQMTFLLPGGGMSPIIVFRLDANTQGSQLINGFNRALPSWNKIEDEISKQLRLLRKGKAEDTGLLVGNQASATQVQALNSVTLQDYFRRQTSFQPVLHGNGYRTVDGFVVSTARVNEPVTDALFPAWALSVDASITSATLDPHHTFRSTGPFNVTAPDNAGAGAVLLSSSSGFFGRDIAITTHTIDLSPYGSLPYFDFLAAKNLSIAGSLNFIGAAPSLYLTLIAGGQFQLAPGATLSADAYNFYLGGASPLQFTDVQIQAPVGNLLMKGSSTLTLSGVTASAGLDVNLASDSTGVGNQPAIFLDQTTLSTGGAVRVHAAGDVTLSSSALRSTGPNALVLLSSDNSLSLNGGSLLSAGSGSSISGGLPANLVLLNGGANVGLAGTSVTADSMNVQAGGSITLNGGAAIAAATVVLNAGDGILLDNVTLAGNSSAPSSLHVTAKNTLTIGSAAHSVDLTAYAAPNLTAHTINLMNTAFGAGSNPVLTSFNGLLAPDPNNNHASMPGFVNFISGVTYGGVLVTGANQSTYVNPAGGSGFHLMGGAL